MDRVEDCVSFVFGKAAQQISKRARERLAPYGVTPVQYAVLAVLWGAPGSSAADLCSRLVMDSATVTGVVDRLEANGIIERRADPKDRRIHRLFVTRAGQALKAPLDAQMEALNVEILRELGMSADTIMAGLRRMGSGTAQGQGE